MAHVKKRKTYQNRQAGYTDQYTVAYQAEDDGTYSIWAEQRPADPYRDKDEAHVDLNGEKVCVRRGQEPRTLERAEAIAHAWMLGYSEYVRTGEFPRGSRRVDV